MMGRYSMMAGMGWIGFILMILFWVGVVLLIAWGISGAFPITRTRPEPEALELLKRRFARGEISQTEFEQARLTLQ